MNAATHMLEGVAKFLTLYIPSNHISHAILAWQCSVLLTADESVSRFTRLTVRGRFSNTLQKEFAEIERSGSGIGMFW